MHKKFIDIHCKLLTFCGIVFSLYLIITKEVFIEISGYKINLLFSIMDFFVLVVLTKQLGKMIKS